MRLPLAHLGHYLWVFYLVPVVIVVAGIVRSSILSRRHRDEERDGSSAD